MLATPVTLAALYTRLFNTFAEVRGTVSSDLLRLATRVPSTTKLNTYAWLGGIPKFREWVGQRFVNGLSQRVFQIANKDYENTIGIDRDTLDDQTLTEPQMIVRGMAYEAAALPHDLLINLLRNGNSTVCYDGQYFFDTDHPVNIDAVTGSQSNYRTSFALTRANFITARAALRGFKGENGRPFMPIGKLLLVVPPELEDTARSIVEVNMLAVSGGTQTNTLFGAAEVIVVPELSLAADGTTDTSTTWYLFVDDAMDPKPFIVQERQAPRFQSKINPDEENVFWHKEYIFGADARFGAGYGAWFKAFKAVA